MLDTTPVTTAIAAMKRTGTTDQQIVAAVEHLFPNLTRRELVEDNRGLALRNYVGTRPMGAKTEGALLVLGVLLAFGLIDRAVAQQQSPPGQGQVQIVPQSPPQTPGYKQPKPYQVTPQTSQPTPEYPQYQVAPDAKQPKQQK
jgi:hypothetical protein